MAMDEASIINQLVAIVLQFGFPGVVIIVLALTIRALWQDNKALREGYFSIAVKSVQVMEANTHALNQMTNNLLRGNKP